MGRGGQVQDWWGDTMSMISVRLREQVENVNESGLAFAVILRNLARHAHKKRMYDKLKKKKRESVNESEQDKIKQHLMKKGDNEKDATEKLKYYDMVSKMYKGANSTKKAEIMSSLWANESVNEGVSKSQAQEIMNQLGGRKFEMLMGVKSKGIGKDGLILHIGKNPKRVSHIIIDLDRGRDLYNLTFGKIVKYQFKIVMKLKGIYVDQLHDMIEKYTGNLTTFRPRR